ncbi:uncharacterized protein LOC124286054 [Haliotis rubra]|uniref:uncharacterized protein LOC124286054 n=1 Tax=Haliotis rubra TaxID=36100 RepID=UPI001EE5BB21|nr:uncharacterized protein LOC124286054 [Haliotis rubra]
MMYRTLLCLALFVGSVSAWGSWFGKNRETECGSFRNQRRGWFFSNSMTDVDTHQVLDDLKAFDTNKDGYLIFEEMYNLEVASTMDSSLNLNTGIDRCAFVMFEMKRYGISKGVAGRLFDLEDVNNDLMISTADQDVVYFNLLDKDADGRVPVCDVFKGFMARLADLEHKVYAEELKYTELVYKFRKPSVWWSGWW